MELHFEPVTMENQAQMERLQLLPAQSGFIESVSECLSEAKECRAWRPVGIYDRDTLIGFAMYGCFPEPAPRVWLDRLLIDQSFQGKGYGKAAVAALLERIRTEYGCGRVYLSVYDVNTTAIALYEKIGFRFNGELDTKGEKVMVLSFS